MPKQYKIIFTGPMGAGKTTAIQAVSEIAVVSTDARNLDRAANTKTTTTVAMDYGEISLDQGDRLRLYGTPGQQRFNFMWEILARGALGLVLLLDNTRSQPLADLALYLDDFAGLIEASGVVVGVTRTDIAATPSVDDYCDYLADLGRVIPVFAVDARNRDDVLMLLDNLLTILE